MAVTLSNVWEQPCEILIAARTNDVTETNHTNANGGGAQQIWFHAGTVKRGSGKFTESENTYEPHIGKTKISSNLGIEVVGIEVDDTAVDTLEALENKVCDIILQPVRAVATVSSPRVKILGVRPRLSLDGSFDGKDILGLKLVAESVYRNVTEFVKRITADWVLAPGGSTLSWPYDSHIYIAARSDPNTPVSHTTNTGWIDVGAHKAGNGKITASEQTVDTTRGKLTITKNLGFTATALETDDTKLAALVAKEGSICDVLLAPINSTSNERIKLLGVIPRIGFEGGFDGSDVPGASLKCEGMFNKLSDFITKTTATWRL